MKTKTTPPARSDIVVLKQLLKHIPRSLISEVARVTGVEVKTREFCVFSHLCSMLFAQLTHAMGLNDVCDWLRLKQAALAGVGAVPPSRNGLSHANKVRPAEFIETLFWRVLQRLQTLDPSFATGEIVVFDKAYVDFDHMADLDARGVWWVTRAKDNMSFRVRRNMIKDEWRIPAEPQCGIPLILLPSIFPPDRSAGSGSAADLSGSSPPQQSTRGKALRRCDAIGARPLRRSSKRPTPQPLSPSNGNSPRSHVPCPERRCSPQSRACGLQKRSILRESLLVCHLFSQMQTPFPLPSSLFPLPPPPAGSSGQGAGTDLG